MLKKSKTMLNNFSNVANVSNSSRSFDMVIDKNLLKIEVLTMTLVFVLALVGNSIVVITLLLRSYFKKNGINKIRTKISRMNFFILHLSIADIYVSLGNILTNVLWRRNNNLFFSKYDIICKLTVYFQVVTVYYS